MKHAVSYSVAAVIMAIGVSPAMAKDKAAKNPAPELVAVGDPVSCISPSQIRSTRIIDDQTIDFDMGGGKVYRNHMAYTCPGLKSEGRFAYKLNTSQLCSVDIITVLYNYGFGLQQGPSCGLGTFQKMEKPGK